MAAACGRKAPPAKEPPSLFRFRMATAPESKIWTIGHSNRTIEKFTALLKGEMIAQLADVRRFPGSRRYPHFAKGNLTESLAGIGIEYVHLPELGGRREPLPNSPNSAWRNDAFRGYADYMMTREFQAAAGTLEK